MSFELKKEKITQIRLHQALIFGGKQETWFSSEDVRGRVRVDFEFVPELQCIYVSNHSDKALVPLVNIAFMKLETEESKKKLEEVKAEQAKPKSTNKSHQIKRPK